jgi:uncharacterized protein (TIGR02284 family)
METTQTIAVLEDLNQTLEDGREGFRSAADKLAEDGHDQLATEMREFSSQRDQLSRELVKTAADHGLTIETGEGSAAGALHRSWMSMKDALTGDDPHAILSAAERGEDHAVAQFRGTLSEDLPAAIRAVVDQQAAAVKAAHDRVRDLRDSRA